MSSPSSFEIVEATARTKYEQEVAEQEDKLTRTLSRIYRDIKRDSNIELSTTAAGGSSRVTWTEIQQLYRKQTEDANTFS